MCPSVLRPSVSRSAGVVASLGLFRLVVSAMFGSADPFVRSPAPYARSQSRPRTERCPCASVDMQMVRALSDSAPSTRCSPVPQGAGWSSTGFKRPSLTGWGALPPLQWTASPSRVKRSTFSVEAQLRKGCALHLAKWAKQRVFRQLSLES